MKTRLVVVTSLNLHSQIQGTAMHKTGLYIQTALLLQPEIQFIWWNNDS